MSLFPQNDPAEAGTSPVPSPLAFQDPSLFSPDPTKILAAATAMGRLGQVSAQLDLEKAQRKAEMAATDYKIALTGHLLENLPQAAAADAAGYGANIASSNAAAAGSNLALAKTQVAAPADIAAAGVAAGNTLASAKADAAFAALPTPLKQAVLSNASTYGQTAGGYGVLMNTGNAAPAVDSAAGAVTPPSAGGQPGIPPFLSASGPAFSSASDPAGISPIMGQIMKAKWVDAFTDPKDIEEYDPKTGVTKQVHLRLMKDGSGVYSRTELGTTKTDTARVVTKAATDLENLASSQNLVNNVQTALEEFNKAYPNVAGYGDTLKRMGQASAAVGASKLADSQLSVIEKGLGGLAESPPTRNLVTALQNLGQSVSRLDGESAKGLTAILPSIGDLTNPEMLDTKLKGVQDYLGSRLKAYADTGVASRMPGVAAVQANTTAGKPTASAPAGALPDGARAVLNGVPVHRVTINGISGWMPDSGIPGK